MSMALDSYAWIEYFGATEKGKKLDSLLQQGETLYTPSICLLEVKNKYLKEEKPYKDRILFMTLRSKIVDLNIDIALQAAEEKQNNKLHTADAIIYATAKSVDAELLTGDPHFKNLAGVSML